MISNWMRTRGNAFLWKTPTFPLLQRTRVGCLLSPARLLLEGVTLSVGRLGRVTVHNRTCLLPLRHRGSNQLLNCHWPLLCKLRDSSRSVDLLKIRPCGKDPDAGVKVGTAGKPRASCGFGLVGLFWDRRCELEISGGNDSAPLKRAA